MVRNLKSELEVHSYSLEVAEIQLRHHISVIKETKEMLQSRLQELSDKIAALQRGGESEKSEARIGALSRTQDRLQKQLQEYNSKQLAFLAGFKHTSVDPHRRDVKRVEGEIKFKSRRVRRELEMAVAETTRLTSQEKKLIKQDLARLYDQKAKQLQEQTVKLLAKAGTNCSREREGYVSIMRGDAILFEKLT